MLHYITEIYSLYSTDKENGHAIHCQPVILKKR